MLSWTNSQCPKIIKKIEYFMQIDGKLAKVTNLIIRVLLKAEVFQIMSLTTIMVIISHILDQHFKTKGMILIRCNSIQRSQRSEGITLI